ncbi:MAG: zinc ribbon domain-containing protein [Bacteroidales bacterium]|nr:zinc ribbon domain-containing protein [Bacteroidales bacterium]
MFIIFGFGQQTKKENKLSSYNHCLHCNNNSQWILKKTTYWFTLFFLPVIPYKIRYSVFCPVCNYEILLNREEYENKLK